MAKFNQSHSSLPDTSCNLTLQKDVCAVSSSSYILRPDYEGRFTPFLTQNVRPPSLTEQLFKPAETQRDVFTSFVSPHPKAVKSAMQGNTGMSAKLSVSSVSAMPVQIDNRKLDATTVLKPETQRPSLPSIPKPHLGTKLFRPTPMQTQTTQKPKYIRTHGAQNTFQIQSNHPSHPKKRLPDVPSPPTKPSRPPNVDIHQFRRNRNNLIHGEKLY